MSQKSKPFEITIIKGMALLIPLSIFMLFFSFLGFDLDVYYYTLFEDKSDRLLLLFYWFFIPVFSLGIGILTLYSLSNRKKQAIPLFYITCFIGLGPLFLTLLEVATSDGRPWIDMFLSIPAIIGIYLRFSSRWNNIILPYIEEK